MSKSFDARKNRRWRRILEQARLYAVYVSGRAADGDEEGLRELALKEVDLEETINVFAPHTRPVQEILKMMRNLADSYREDRDRRPVGDEHRTIAAAKWAAIESALREIQKILGE